MRLTDVAADPTNMLALEAAVRRRVDARGETIRLSGITQVVRAQRFTGPRSFAHFALLGMVSAGRDRGHRAFEVDELDAHIRTLERAVRAVEPNADVQVAVSDHGERVDEAHELIDRLRSHGLAAEFDPDRTHGASYYEHLCFKLRVTSGGELFEIGDGGSVPWTRDLLANRKERLVISGLGLDRLVMLVEG